MPLSGQNCVCVCLCVSVCSVLFSSQPQKLITFQLAQFDSIGVRAF